jgi:hypothetical protein
LKTAVLLCKDDRKIRPSLFHVFWTHEKKTFFSYQSLTWSGGVGQGRAILRAAQPAKRLDGRWSGGYFATGAEDLASSLLAVLKDFQSRTALADCPLLNDGVEGF